MKSGWLQNIWTYVPTKRKTQWTCTVSIGQSLYDCESDRSGQLRFHYSSHQSVCMLRASLACDNMKCLLWELCHRWNMWGRPSTNAPRPPLVHWCIHIVPPALLCPCAISPPQKQPSSSGSYAERHKQTKLIQCQSYVRKQLMKVLCNLTVHVHTHVYLKATSTFTHIRQLIDGACMTAPPTCIPEAAYSHSSTAGTLAQGFEAIPVNKQAPSLWHRRRRWNAKCIFLPMLPLKAFVADLHPHAGFCWCTRPFAVQQWR